MKVIIWKTVLRFVELIGIVTALVFVFEATTAKRSFPAFDGMAETSLNGFEFFDQNNGSIVYVELFFDRDNFEGLSSDEELEILFYGLTGFERNTGAVGVLKWSSLTRSNLINIVDDRAEDLSFSIAGPVFVKIHEGEGVKYVELFPAPYTEMVAGRANCTELLLGAEGVSFFYKYIAGCMLGLAV